MRAKKKIYWERTLIRQGLTNKVEQKTEEGSGGVSFK